MQGLRAEGSFLFQTSFSKLNAKTDRAVQTGSVTAMCGVLKLITVSHTWSRSGVTMVQARARGTLTVTDGAVDACGAGCGHARREAQSECAKNSRTMTLHRLGPVFGSAHSECVMARAHNILEDH
eukprot:2294875-Rhodomonas_salina.1